MTSYFRTSVGFAALVCVGLFLSACTNPKKSLGLEKGVPDEFAVVPRAPLALPPDYSLRPPQPGADRPQEMSARDQARSTIVGGRSSGETYAAGTVAGTVSSGESVLLRQAGADRANPDIRTVVNRESSILADESKSFTDRLVFWRKDEEPGQAVDPEAEMRRIRENQSLGKPATEGRTPIIERREKGLLEGIF